MDSQINNLIKIIKYTPPLSIVISILFISILIINEEKNEIREDQKLIKKQFFEDEKNRIQRRIRNIYNIIKYEHNHIEKELKKKLIQDVNNIYEIIYNINKEEFSKKTRDEIIKSISKSLNLSEVNYGYSRILSTSNTNSIRDFKTFLAKKEVKYSNFHKNKLTNKFNKIINGDEQEGFIKYNINKLGDQQFLFVKAWKEFDLVIISERSTDTFKLDIQKKVLKRLTKIQYRNNGYIFAFHFNGDILYHPSNKISNGNIFKENKFLHIKEAYSNLVSDPLRDKGTLINIKPKIIEGNNTKEIKITYAKRFDEWKWIISTSFKLSDVQKRIKEGNVLLEKKYTKYKNTIISYGIFFSFLLLILSSFISRKIERRFLRYQERLNKAHEMAKLGEWEYCIKTKESVISQEILEMYDAYEVTDNLFVDYLQEILHNDDLESFNNAFQSSIKTGHEYSCIYRIHKLNGKISWISTKGTVKNGFIIGISQDITELKQLERERELQNQLLFQQSKMANMGDMINNIAHQWRQPLNRIGLSSQFIASLTHKDNNEIILKKIANINRNVQYMSTTIEDFMNFFHPEKEKKVFNFEIVVEKVLKLIKIRTPKIVIHKNIPKDFSINSYENEFTQIILILMENALDNFEYTKKIDPVINITIIEVDTHYSISINDNGGGIPKEIQDKVFEPYFTTKFKKEGSGIGLYMAKMIIEKSMQGEILLDSHNNLTTFTIRVKKDSL